jgi:hypothetical protein
LVAVFTLLETLDEIFSFAIFRYIQFKHGGHFVGICHDPHVTLGLYANNRNILTNRNGNCRLLVLRKFLACRRSGKLSQ